MDSYEAALGRLGEGDREAIIARVELELPYREIAEMLESPRRNRGVGRARR